MQAYETTGTVNFELAQQFDEVEAAKATPVTPVKTRMPSRTPIRKALPRPSTTASSRAKSAREGLVLWQPWGLEEAKDEGVKFLSLDPGDMDTSLHTLAVPDADPATPKRPEDAAREIVASMLGALRENGPLDRDRRRSNIIAWT